MSVPEPALASSTTPPAFSAKAPKAGDVLEPGDHLVELELARPCSPDILERGLLKMGWQEVLLDQTTPSKSPPVKLSKTGPAAAEVATQWGTGEEIQARFADSPHTSRFRFVGRLTVHLEVQDRESVRWIYEHCLTMDPLSDLRLKLMSYALKRDQLYEVRFLARSRAHPSAAIVAADLRAMGWDPHKLSALKCDMRIPGRPGASVTLWLGLARWDRAASYITAEDPFYFEDVVGL